MPVWSWNPRLPPVASWECSLQLLVDIGIKKVLFHSQESCLFWGVIIAYFVPRWESKDCHKKKLKNKGQFIVSSDVKAPDLCWAMNWACIKQNNGVAEPAFTLCLSSMFVMHSWNPLGLCCLLRLVFWDLSAAHRDISWAVTKLHGKHVSCYSDVWRGKG